MNKKFLLTVITLITFSGKVLALVPAETLYLNRTHDLGLNSKGVPKKKFFISNTFHDAQINIQSELTEDERDFNAKLNCQGMKSETFYSGKKKLKIKKGVPYCDLIYSQSKRIRLINDETAFNFLKDYHRREESCHYQTSKKDNSIDSMFFTNNFDQMTCVTEGGETEVLANSEEALLVKIESLLGKKLSKGFITNQNPYAELDFSQAPKLKAIFLSTLLYRHDFTGVVLARLLDFHAKRGTLVNIIGTRYMHNDKDKALFKKMLENNPNIRMQEYKYQSHNLLDRAKYLSYYLRDMHVKLFVTLSEVDEKRNMVIIGGRNVHDGFVFSEKPNFSEYPELNQVDPEADYAYWQDLEVKITSKKLAQSTYAHLLKLWNRKLVGQELPNLKSKSPNHINHEDLIQNSHSGILIRHFLSIPTSDDSALEKLYVNMIDSAQNTIRISSPYLRPTKAIMQALDRALERNKEMEIIIQTRINLAGDTQAWLYEETNKKAINKLFNKVKIYEWQEDSILHTKLLIIDDNFVFIGSVNLSQRSFIHDLESGYMVRSPEFTKTMTDLFEGYNNHSKLITNKQKRRFWGSIISELFKTQF